MENGKKDINFEINLLPVISLLAVLICFLLLTTVWVQLGSIDVAQAIGAQSSQGGANQASVWATISDRGHITFNVKDVRRLKKSLRKVTIRSRANQINWKPVGRYLAKLKETVPTLNTVLINPSSSTSYDTIVKLMDQVRKQEIRDIGINPL